MVSVIIPTYNEERWVARTLESLRSARGDFEVIVADGASTDGTRLQVERLIPGFPRPLRFVPLERPRARQLNGGAQAAQGEAFWFLHADTLVPPEAIREIERALQDTWLAGGNFSIRFDGDSVVDRCFTWAYRVRRPFGIYYGDSGVFVRRAVFERMNGFKLIPIMDDYEFIRRLERFHRTVCLAPVLQVSGRRWRARGLLRTLLSWIWIQTLYSLGVPSEYLARWYGVVRGSNRSRGED